MQKVIFETGQRIIKALLDHFQDGKEQSDRDRRSDFSEPGILDDVREVQLTGTITFTNGSQSVTGSGSLFTSELRPGDKITDDTGSDIGVVDAITDNTNLNLIANWDGNNGSNTAAKRRIDAFNVRIGDNNNPPTTHSINIEPGIAYDTNGERIEISDPIVVYDPTAPASTSPDGKGGTVVTPQSTGSRNITLTGNSQNFVWLDYLGTRDTSVFTLQKATNKIQYFKQIDGYQITVTTTDTAPTSASLKVATIDLTGGGVVSPSTIDISARIFSGVKVGRQKIELPKADRSDATTSYVPGTEAFLVDHIKAVGTGTITAQNPHGQTVLDFGFDPEESLDQHQQFLHATGIVGDRNTTTSSLYLEHVTVTPGEDFVKIKPLTSSEIVHVNGTIIDSADIPNEISLLFSSSVDGTGTYYVFIDKSLKQVQRSNINPSSDPNKILLWSFTWTADPGGSPMDGNISSIVDHRSFNTTITPILGIDGSASEPTYSWNSDPDTGFYFLTSGAASFSSNGSEIVRFQSAGVELKSGVLKNQLGSVSAPTYTFDGDEDTGVYQFGANQLGITAGNSVSTIFSGTGLRVPDGSAADPSISFINANNTGLFVDSGNGDLKFTEAGVQTATLNQSGFILSMDGTATAPSFRWSTDSDTGLYKGAAGQLNVSVDNSERFRFTGSQLQATLETSGSTTPAFTFTNQTNSGMGLRDVSGSNWLSFVSQGQISLEMTGSVLSTVLPFRTALGGSPSTPTYSFSADPDMGIYASTTDELNIAIGGREAFHFTDTDIGAGFHISRLGVSVLEAPVNNGLGSGASLSVGQDIFVGGGPFEVSFLQHANLMGRRFYRYAFGTGGNLPSGTSLGFFSTNGKPAFIYAVAYSGTNYQSMRVYMALAHQAGPSSHIIQIHEHHAGFDNFNRADIFLENTSTPSQYQIKVSQFTTSGITWHVYGDEG